MTAFRRILVSVDFSPHSRHALEVALGLCRRFDAALGIVHVYEPVVYAGAAPGDFMVTPSLADQAFPAALAGRKQQLETAAEAARLLGVREVTTELLHGATFNEINRCARDGGYDLIVMGTHGRTGVGRLLIGSVAERVVRKAPCAVLTVRLPEHNVTQVGAARRGETQA